MSGDFLRHDLEREGAGSILRVLERDIDVDEFRVVDGFGKGAQVHSVWDVSDVLVLRMDAGSPIYAAADFLGHRRGQPKTP